MLVAQTEKYLRLMPSLLAAGLMLSYTAANGANNKAIRLSQTHVFFGKCQLILAPKGFRMENKGRLHFTVVAKAPEWKVTIFRDDDKVYISESLAQFEESGLASQMLVKRQDKYYLGNNRKSELEFCGKKLVRLTGKFKTVKYMPLNGLPPQIERLVYAAYKTPTNGGISTGFSRVCKSEDFISGMSVRGSIETVLETDKIEDISIGANSFDPPSGYKLAKSVREVVAGESTRDKNADFGVLF